MTPLELLLSRFADPVSARRLHDEMMSVARTAAMPLYESAYAVATVRRMRRWPAVVIALRLAWHKRMWPWKAYRLVQQVYAAQYGVAGRAGIAVKP